MSTVRDVLNKKGHDVWSIGPKASIMDALIVMAEKNVGALVVLQDGELVGICSERDICRGVVRIGGSVLKHTVDEYMTANVLTISPDLLMNDCMVLMDQKHFRHLPVVEKGKLVGLISIRDVVAEVISDKDSTIVSLENYIVGSGFGH